MPEATRKPSMVERAYEFHFGVEHSDAYTVVKDLAKKTRDEASHHSTDVRVLTERFNGRIAELNTSAVEKLLGISPFNDSQSQESQLLLAFFKRGRISEHVAGYDYPSKLIGFLSDIRLLDVEIVGADECKSGHREYEITDLGNALAEALRARDTQRQDAGEGNPEIPAIL